MTFEYLSRIVTDDSIDIDDLGNFSVIATNDIGEELFFISQTELGWTELFIIGPYAIGIDQLPTNVSYFYKRFQYAEKRISSEFSKFLNNQNYSISQVREVSKEEIVPFIRNLADYIR